MAAARLSRPAVHAVAAAVVTLASWTAVASGAAQPGALTTTEGGPGAGAIGLGLLPAILAPMMLLPYLRGVRAVRAAWRAKGYSPIGT